MQQDIKMKGRVNIKAYGPDGEFLWEETKDNLIVSDGRQQICHLLVGDVTNRSVTQIAFGTSSAAVALGDTAPLSGQFIKNIGSVSYPTNTSVLINWTLATGEANGLSITELGLVCANGKLFSRLLRAAIVKTSAISLIGTWELSF